ncbi:MAG TPA: hypothetical protein VNA19_06225 [Pyrinomonadaceae bacterium]|nr:hypothetical protein [Pyrinomonadaceae bacterium]
MKRPLFSLFFAFFVALAILPSARAQQASNTAPASGGGVDVDGIIRAFTAKETQFRKALNEYSFKRDAVIQTLGLGGQISGEYKRVSQFVFDDSGRRYEKILFFPMPTMAEITITAEDLEDLSGVTPFALEAAKANLYKFSYVGKERLDEIDTYIFDVAPKVMPDPKKTKERFFMGRIWVDQQELQIVKARGKGVPEDKNNKYATFETYREQIDGKFWFPTYSYADDELVFGNGQAVHLRARVKYTDFERLSGKVRIIEDTAPGEGIPANTTTPAKPAPSPTPKP